MQCEAPYQPIFNAFPIGVSLADLSGRFVSTNEAFQRILGYTAEELHTLTFMDITHPNDLQPDLDLFQETMAGRRDGYEMTKRYIRKDGQIVWVHLAIVVLRDADGTPRFDFAMVEDITGSSSAESRLGRVALYPPEPRSSGAQRVALIRELRDAIDKDALILYFQPKVDVRTGHIHHAEALVRWPHATRGLVPPCEFVPLAEETGLINALSQRVLDMARGHYERWRGIGLNVSIAVNLSVRNLHDRDILAAIERMFCQGRLPPGAVELEITETGFLDSSRETLAALDRFHELGARIVIDDFGTGYSSLAYLARLPVDEIKIDRSFVADILHNDTNRIIVQATIDLAYNLGLVATAEGVEDAATLALLENMGCDRAQGSYISCPLPAEAFVKWIGTNRYDQRR